MFSGLEQCKIDKDGRLRLPPAHAAQLALLDEGRVVLQYLLPEGCVVIYPLATWAGLQAVQKNEAPKRSADSILQRRADRVVGALTCKTTVADQGRVTIPAMFREHGELKAAEAITVVGCGERIELWNAKRWLAELEAVAQHARAKSDVEVRADLGLTAAPAPPSEDHHE